MSSASNILASRNPAPAPFVPPLLRRYREVRALSAAIAAPLSAEDCCVQSMPDASPIKWHLAHTTWFFERMVLGDRPGYAPFDARYDALFNSYYLALGTPFARPRRGLLSRPGLDEIGAWRAHVDAAMAEAIGDPACRDRVMLGIHHEQQHQELMLTDIKHAFWCNPLLPAYRPRAPFATAAAGAAEWIGHEGGIVPVGHADDGFAFDNEMPRHDVLLRPFRIAARPVTCGEFQAFIDDGGYRRSELWLSDGWALGLERPLYWLDADRLFTLAGPSPIDPAEPVAHVSFYEAAAFAVWAGKRLATEQEWEAAARREPAAGNFLDLDVLAPRAASRGGGLFGDVWTWTRSAYDPYPGFRPFDGALAEYSGKFMTGQMVLRGGSCATPEGHVRASYRNFFPPAARWQFSGIRLAEDA